MMGAKRPKSLEIHMLAYIAGRTAGQNCGHFIREPMGTHGGNIDFF